MGSTPRAALVRDHPVHSARLCPLSTGSSAPSLLIFDEDPEEYRELWAALEADWQPQNRTERLHLEQMATSQWLLARMARGESRIYEAALPLEKQLALLDRVSTQRVRLEHYFRDAMRELKQLQKERQPQRQPPVEAKPTGQSAPAPVPHLSYVMSEAREASKPRHTSPITHHPL